MRADGRAEPLQRCMNVLGRKSTVESAGSAAIPSQLMIMATASRGVKPDTRRLQGVIRKFLLEDLFSRFISWRSLLFAQLSPRVAALFPCVPALSRRLAALPPYPVFAHPRPRRRPLFSRPRALAADRCFRAPAPPPPTGVFAPPRPPAYRCFRAPARCVLRDACCAMRVARCVLRDACCAMRVARCVLRDACC
jgi:hypothetical protein